MSSTWSTIYSALPLLVALGVVYVAFRSSGLLSSSTKSKPVAQKRAVPVPASSDHQQPQSTPNGRTAPVSQPIESSTPQKAQPIPNGIASGVSSAMPTPERKGFQRGKKLA